MTRTIASNSVLITSLIDSRTKSLVSSAIRYSIPSGKRRLHLLHRLAHRVRHHEAVGARLLVDGDDRRRHAVHLAVDDVLLQPDLGARDVADAHDGAAVLARAQDDVLVLLGLGVLRLRDDRERELDRARVRLLADLARAEELVLLADRVGDVGRRDAERGHAVRIHPDPHRLVGHAHDLRLARAVDALQRVEHVDVGVVGDVVRAVAVVLGVDRHQHHDRRRLLLHVDALLHDGGRQLRHREVDAVLHLHLRDVGVGVEREVHRHRQLAGRRADRRHVEHVVDAVDLLLDRRGDRIRRASSSRRPGYVADTVTCTGVMLGYCATGSWRHRHQPGEADDQRDDRREDRALDEEPREHAGAAGLLLRRRRRPGAPGRRCRCR